MTTERIIPEQVLEKVKKLLALAEGAKKIGSTNEAEVAAAKATGILLDYKLTLEDLTHLDKKEDKDPMGTTYFNPKEYNLKKNKTRIEWKESLGEIVAEYTFCIHLVVTGSSSRWFVGRQTDREVAVYLYAFLVRSIEETARKEYDRLYARAEYYGTQKDMLGWKAGFIQGALAGVLSKMESERASSLRSARNQEMALTIVKKSVDAVRKYMEEERQAKAEKSGNKALAKPKYVDELKVSSCSASGWAMGYDYGKNLKTPNALGSEKVNTVKQLV